ncbi:MAG: hypothetical protein MI922_00520 [Bacteroidales bacterium]|nr:hypothetical protein [Bacteroidales bacterium]
MIIKNKFDKPLGPSASFSGYLFLFFGAITITSGLGIFFIIIGSFMAFTRTGIILDKDKNRYRLYTNLFGLIKVGKWKGLEDFRGLAILKDHKSYRAYSQTNRTNTTKPTGYFIYMLHSDGKTKVPVKKCKTLEIVKGEINKLSEYLMLPMVN